MSALTLDAQALYAELLTGVRALWRPDMVVGHCDYKVRFLTGTGGTGGHAA